LEEVGIQLWNWAVTKRVGSTITEGQKAKGRSVCLSVSFCLSINGSGCQSVCFCHCLFHNILTKESFKVYLQMFSQMSIIWYTTNSCFSASCGMQTSVFMRA